jgi:hypothetical protein
MNSYTQSLISPYTGQKMSTPPSYVEDVLRTMLNDQSDHVYAKFSESYMKVCAMTVCCSFFTGVDTNLMLFLSVVF